MEVQGDQLFLYVDDKAVGITTGTFMLPESHDYVSCLEPESERTFEVTGVWPELPDLTPAQEWNYQWYRSKELPRKAKKAYRKKLLKLLA